jgi:hypothetical protein
MRDAIRLMALVAGVSLLPAALIAQYPDPGTMGGSGRPGGGFRQRTGPTERALPSEVQLDGPPVPDFFVPRFLLDSTQAGRYRSAYDSFMSATAQIRDSALAARRFIDNAFQQRERGTARAAFPVLQQLGDSLTKLDTRFDQSLKAFLSSRQLKNYKKWKDEQRRQQEAQQREEMQRRMAGARGDTGDGP